MLKLTLLALAVSCASASAQTVTALNFDAPVTINSFPAGTFDGYDILAETANTDVAADPSYGTVALYNLYGAGGNGNYSSLSFDGGTAFVTGSLNSSMPSYDPSSTLSGANYGHILFTLTSDVSSFEVSVLSSNGDYTPNNGIITVSLYDTDGNLVSDAALNDSSDSSLGTASSNLFYSASVTGAASGDTVVVSDSLLVGGIVLSGGAVPEPGTYALLGLGVLALVMALRRRSQI